VKSQRQEVENDREKGRNDPLNSAFLDGGWGACCTAPTPSTALRVTHHAAGTPNGLARAMVHSEMPMAMLVMSQLTTVVLIDDPAVRRAGICTMSSHCVSHCVYLTVSLSLASLTVSLTVPLSLCFEFSGSEDGGGLAGDSAAGGGWRAHSLPRVGGRVLGRPHHAVDGRRLRRAAASVRRRAAGVPPPPPPYSD
jgi:hypothetical protein